MPLAAVDQFAAVEAAAVGADDGLTSCSMKRPVSVRARSAQCSRARAISACQVRLLKVARSSFYAWLAGEKARSARKAADDALAHEITVLHLASKATYGVPRIHAGLRRLGHRVNRKRIERPSISLRCGRLRIGWPCCPWIGTRRGERGPDRPSGRSTISSNPKEIFLWPRPVAFAHP
ncbi:IS3 family transposase [Streptomyces sp. NPDC087787]|uniref:IS3 family transposase n=1 Tax=Streptomyces sp. NPDC087787 TaxID=3365803 RepID=UPI00380A8869